MANSSIYNAFERMWQHTNDAINLAGHVKAEEVPNLYVWEKLKAEHATAYEVVKTDVTNVRIGYKLSYKDEWDEVRYADSYELQGDTIALINPTTVNLDESNRSVVLGKYVYYNGSYYEIPSTSKLSSHSGTVYKEILVDNAKQLIVNSITDTQEAKLGYVSSKSFNTYPTNGEHTDGYWYKYIKQMGDSAVVDGSSVAFTETDPTVPAWAKEANKPTYTASEVGALPNTTVIPDALSDLAEDATHRTVTDTEKSTWNAKANKSDIPTVPTKVSAFENDKGYLTQHQSLAGYAKTSDVPTKVSDLTNDSKFATETYVDNKLSDVNGILIDPTLSIEGQAADAKAVGDALANIEVSASIDVAAEVGKTIVVKTVDVNGKPTEWEAVDYQPRTHWTYEDGTVRKLDNKYINAEWMATKETSGDSTLYIPEQTISSGIWNNLQISLQSGFFYDVTINGEVYTCDARTDDGGVILGNNISMNLNDYPFCISWAGDGATAGMFFKNDTLSYPITLKVTGHIETVYNKLPVEYLTDCVVKSVNGKEPDVNGNVVVEIPEGGTVTDEQIASAVEEYLTENPIDGNNNLLVVTFTDENGTLTPSHTFEQIKECVDNGGYAVLTDGKVWYNLATLSGSLVRFERVVIAASESYLIQYVITIMGAMDKLESHYNHINVTAEVGQTIAVKSVDANGKPTEWEAVDMPTGGGSGLSETAKNLLITILRNGAYSTDQSDNIAALVEELNATEEKPDVPDIDDDGGLNITDDGQGNVTIESTGSTTITDDGQGNVTIESTGSTTITDDGQGNVTII